MSILRKLLILTIILPFCTCGKINEYNHEPELESLRQGLRTSAAVGYCASIVMSVENGKQLPANVVYDKNTGLIYVKIDNNHPLLFTNKIGDIVIAYTWSQRAGLMSVLFANFDVLGGKTKLYGLHLVPLMKNLENDGVLAVFQKQDIIIGNGSDTLLDMSNITDIVFNSKIDQLNSDRPNDVFVAAKQNVWFINIDPNNTYSNVYDDNITINGGGQIAEVVGNSGGVIYHGMIDTKINYSICNQNPVSGFALSQNFKVGGEPYIDLGSSLLSFHNNCDGKVHVDISTGKYLNYFNKDISLFSN
jgi:hypothetical protein